MSSSAKSKNFFVDFSEHNVLIARTSRGERPFVVEEIIECAPGDSVALADALKSLQPKKTPSGFFHAKCGINASRRVVRKVIFDTKRLKEAEYLNEVTEQQVRVEPADYTLSIINPTDGADYDFVKAAHKEALVCGLPSKDINDAQEQLLAASIYPETVELSSVAGVGAMINYLAFANIKTPVLMLEVGSEVTHSFIVTASGVEASRPIQQGLDAMIPVVQKELGLKDEASARKLFLSNTFDFTGMGSVLIKKLIKELQSSIGFYEVQTGQSVANLACVLLPAKLGWLENAIAADLGVSVIKPDISVWLQSHQITLSDNLSISPQDIRRIGLFGLMTQHARTISFDVKTSDKAAQALCWHPDFRNINLLPDIKVVRTSFFINGLSLTVAIALAVFTGFKEIELRSLSFDTEIAQKNIEKNKPVSDQVVIQFKKFQAEESKIQEVKLFLSASKIPFSDFLLELGGTIPSGIKLNNVNCRESDVSIIGEIDGSSEEGAGKAAEYVELLRRNPTFNSMFSSVTLVSIVREADNRKIRFEVGFKYKLVDSKSKSGGAK